MIAALLIAHWSNAPVGASGLAPDGGAALTFASSGLSTRMRAARRGIVCCASRRGPSVCGVSMRAHHTINGTFFDACG
jgi:hypothetical protein